METLGPHGLAVVVDLVDAIALGSRGIHIVVTDRPEAVKAEIEARCPKAWTIAPLLAAERDRLSEAAHGGSNEQGVLLLDIVEPGEAHDLSALHALNDHREGLLRRGFCAVVIVAGKDVRGADAGYLELQAHAPDFWSVRNRVHRVVGPDPERRARDELLDLVAVRFDGDRGAAARWLDGRSLLDDWSSYRLWREGRLRAEWIALAVPSEAAEILPFIEGDSEANDSAVAWSHEPIGHAIPVDRWPRPVWPSGQLPPAQHVLVEALGAALERDGVAELFLLPEDASPDTSRTAVLTLGLLRESQYDLILHFDACESLESAIIRCLHAAGDTFEASGLIRAARRLRGAIGTAKTLLVITDAEQTDLDFLRAAMPGQATVSTQRVAPETTFCVVGSPGSEEYLQWAEHQLSAWLRGSTRRVVQQATALLDLRAALARAQYIVLLTDPTWSALTLDVLQPITLTSHRTAAFSLGSAPSFLVAPTAIWAGELGPDEATALTRLRRVAHEMAGGPVTEQASPDVAWPAPLQTPPLVSGHASRVALVSTVGVPKGSGYLVDVLHVLTAAHAVRDVDVVEARLCGEARPRPGRVVWRGQGRADVALLRLDQEVESNRGDDPEWASCGISDLECEAIGYPKFQDQTRHDGAGHKDTETERFVGRLEPYAGLEHGQINAKHLTVTRGNEDWQGISGAGLLVQGLLVGVVTHANVDRLLAWPVARLLEDRDFVAAWGGGRTLLTDALWPSGDQPLLHALRPWEARVPTSMQPAKLLDAWYEVVPFDEQGRSEALGLLQEFVSDRRRDGALVVVGPGGVGKTRLMLEWCRRMRNDREQPWIAGFLQRDLPEDVGSLVRGRTPRLVVLDYAETDPLAAASLLRAMVERRTGPRMRVVLLAREDGPWLRYIRNGDSGVADCLDAYPVHRLQDLYVGMGARERGFLQAQVSFAGLGKGQGQRGADARSGLGGVALEEDVADRALYQHMRALLSAQDRSDAINGSLPSSTILERALDHERRFWTRFIEKATGRHVGELLGRGTEQAAAALVLCGGVAGPSAADSLFELAAPEIDATQRRIVIECFVELYEGPTQQIMPIEPDLLGEALVAMVIERDAREEGGLRKWLSLPFEAQAPRGALTRTLTVLTRLANRSEIRVVGLAWLEGLLRGHGQEIVERVDWSADDGRADPPGSVVEQAIAAIEDVDLAAWLGDLMQEATVELREARVKALEVAVVGARRSGRVDEGRLAGFLSNYGFSLSDVGSWREALAATQEAVYIYRRLAPERPEVLPMLASALNNLGLRLGDEGLDDEALVATEEATEIRRRLAIEMPSDADSSSLAQSLTNRGMRLSSLGRHEEALAEFRKAEEVYRGLAQKQPTRFLPRLAVVLNNLGVGLGHSGQREEALLASREAVGIYRELVRARRNAFLPDLAGALNNLGPASSEVGMLREALVATREAVEIYRKLVEGRPKAFLPDLALALMNLGLWLTDLGEREEALAITREAVEVYRDLVQDRPGTFMPSLAGALNNLGLAAARWGTQEEALAATREAVAIRRQLAKERPEVFSSELAKTLSNLGMMLGMVGMYDEALAATQEAVEIRRRPTNEQPGVIVPELATSLGAHGTVCLRAGLHARALDAFGEGLGLILPDALRLPQAFGRLAFNLAGQTRRAAREGDLPVSADLAALLDQVPDEWAG